MALKALVCPQCGANLSLEDSNEYGYCQHCGAKVMLHETIEVRHSGSVKIDTSEQEANYIRLANNSLAAGNYDEAYTYYMKTLETNPDNVIALYMKGICAVYISDPQMIRTNEYIQSVNQAKKTAYDTQGVLPDNLLVSIEQQSDAMVNWWVARGLPEQPVTNEQGECISEFSKSVNIANLGLNVVKNIYSEGGKEKLIDLLLDFIGQVKKVRLRYFAGTKTDKKGRTTQVFNAVALTNDQQRSLDSVSKELRDIFNNLPSRIALSSDINDRLSVADEEVSQLKGQLRELKSQRNSLYIAGFKERKDPERKAQIKTELAALDVEIKALEDKLGDARSVSKDINGELKDFRKTVK